MLWGDFFMKLFLKRHAGWCPNPGIAGVSALLSCFFGTLVWVNCRGAWFVMRFAKLPSFAPSLSLSYTLWVVCYGFFGAAFYLCLSTGGKRVIADIGLILASYFLSLLWQPLFYSAHFLLLSLVILTAAFAISAAFLIRMIRRNRFASLGAGIIAVIQGFFIAVTVCCF